MNIYMMYIIIYLGIIMKSHHSLLSPLCLGFGSVAVLLEWNKQDADNLPEEFT